MDCFQKDAVGRGLQGLSLLGKKIACDDEIAKRGELQMG